MDSAERRKWRRQKELQRQAEKNRYPTDKRQAEIEYWTRYELGRPDDPMLTLSSEGAWYNDGELSGWSRKSFGKVVYS